MRLVLIGAIFLLAGAAVIAATERGSIRSATDAERRARGHLAVGWAVSAVCGLLSFAVCLQVGGSLGRGYLIAPAVAGAVVIGVMAVSERTSPHEVADLRSVSLARRSGWGLLSGTSRALAAAALAAVIGLLVLATTTATADDMGRRGRAVAWTTRDGGQRSSPWPGSFYAAPVALALVVMSIAFVLGLRSVARRPQVNADADRAVADDDLRGRSARALHGTFLLALGATLGGVSLAMSSATSNSAAGSPLWVSVAHGCATAGLVGAVICAFWGLLTMTRGRSA